jgi:pilus assembly protein CpaB
MMRPKSLALLLLALGCGLVASIGITEVMAKRNAEPAGAVGDTQSIFVAMTDIGLGDLLTSQLLKLEQWPKDKIPVGAISRIEDVEGRRARTKLYSGEPILENKLLGKGASEQGATALIPKGYRVVTVHVDLVSGGSSLILPGDRVDVMVHLVRDTSRDIQETVTRTILQDIKVFAVNDVVDLEREKDTGKSITAKTISLLVTPEQAAKVMLASQLGSVNLVMRSSEDDQQTPNAQARPGELFAVGAKSDRNKESLMAPSDPNLNDKTKNFLDFLNSMKGKSSTGGASPTAEASPPRQTWTMRMLKPGDVAEVQFEAEATQAASTSAFGTWKTATMAGSSGGTPPAKNEPKMIAPPTPEPVAPLAEGPPPHKQEPKKDKIAN